MLPPNPFISTFSHLISASEFLESLELTLASHGYRLNFIDPSTFPEISNQRKEMVRKISPGLFLLRVGEHQACIASDSREVSLLESSPLRWNPNKQYSRLEMGRLLKNLCALILTLDGYPVFHGNVLHLPNGTTIALLGESGKGKSTLSFALSRLGAQLISDDLCAFDAQTLEIKFESNTLTLSPATFLKLSQSAGVKEQKSKLTIQVNPSYDLKQTPKLACVYKLVPNKNNEIKIQLLSRVEAIFEYLKCSIIDPRALGTSLESYIESRIQFHKSLPLSVLHIPRNFEYLNSACERILAVP